MGKKLEAQLEGEWVLMVMEGVRSVRVVEVRSVRVQVLNLVPVRVVMLRGAGLEWLVEVVEGKCSGMCWQKAVEVQRKVEAVVQLEGEESSTAPHEVLLLLEVEAEVMQSVEAVRPVAVAMVVVVVKLKEAVEVIKEEGKGIEQSKEGGVEI